VTRQRLKNNLIYLGVAALKGLMQALPLALARRLGAGLGRAFFTLVAYERGKALRSLSVAFPEKTEAQRRALGRAAFASIGLGAAEFLRFPILSPADLEALVPEITGLEHLEAPLRQGRGVVAVTSHFGNWELIAQRTVQLHPQTATIAQRSYDSRFEAELQNLRSLFGLRIIPRGASVKPVLKFLKEGGILGLLADQDTNVDSVFVDFFGRPAKTPSGPAWLASATGAALITGFLWRRPDGRYRIEFGPEIPVPEKGAPKEALIPAVREYTRRTEKVIREHPEQWAWMHDRWRSKPPAGK
jgi:Kdo2-lipid IVA lauroyltransferase/acyltransferase